MSATVWYVGELNCTVTEQLAYPFNEPEQVLAVIDIVEVEFVPVDWNVGEPKERTLRPERFFTVKAAEALVLMPAA